MKFHQYLTEATADPMAKEKMSRLILLLEGAVIKRTEKLPNTAPIVKQMIGSLNTIKYLLKNKLKLTGRAAVSEFAQACRGHFTHDFTPLSTLVKKYKLKVDPIRGSIIVDVLSEVNEKVTDIEPMINMYQKSKDYGVPFGIKVRYSGGQSKSYAGNPEHALANDLNRKQVKYVEEIIKAIKGKKKLIGEAQVRNLTMSVPKDLIAKQKFNASIRGRINKDIHKILKPTYFKTIPLDKIQNAMEKHGVVLLQEDYTEWSGFLMGGVKDTEMVHFLLGWKDTKDERGMHRVIPNAAFTMSYFKMPSGKYEVIGYV